MAEAKFIYDSAERNADLYYATHFAAPDPFIYFEVKGKKYLVLSDLEIDRGKKVARVDRVLSLSSYVKRAEKKKKVFTIIDVLKEIFSEHRIKKLVVPQTTSFNLVDALRRNGLKVEAGTSPFYEERLSKTAEEMRLIEASQKVIFAAMRLAEETIKKSRIKGDRIIYRGSALTSEKMQQLLRVFLLERDHFAPEIIVACGMHAIDPHDRGSGPLIPHKSIIVDIFPRSGKTMYYGDATRTFCKGRAPDALKRLYATVKEGQEMGISKLRAGINGRLVHESIMRYFEKEGYQTGEKGGRRQGFFHSTGHSIGLDLHEEPGRIGPRDFIIPNGYITSVEPGLYYAAIGGVRIEDLVYVTKKGCEILSHYPKKLEIR